MSWIMSVVDIALIATSLLVMAISLMMIMMMYDDDYANYDIDDDSTYEYRKKGIQDHEVDSDKG